MEIEQKKAYLRSYQVEERRARRIEERIEALRAKKMHPSMAYDDMPHGTDQKDLSDYMIAVEELMEELKTTKLKAVENCKRIERDISKITATDKEKEGNMKLVLALKYIDGMEWEEIGKRMGYSGRQCQRIHTEALEKINV